MKISGLLWNIRVSRNFRNTRINRTPKYSVSIISVEHRLISTRRGSFGSSSSLQCSVLSGRSTHDHSITLHLSDRSSTMLHGSPASSSSSSSTSATHLRNNPFSCVSLPTPARDQLESHSGPSPLRDELLL